jgi:XTP/dITP diphosphohydrolase
MRIVLASGNAHKRRELGEIFAGHALFVPADLGLDFHHEETGATFLSNAVGKALTLFRLLGEGKGFGVISDDSGISLPALDGAPGVYSARYGELDGAFTGAGPFTDEMRNALLVRRMRGARDRRAFFVCAMVFLVSEFRFFTAQETWEGVLAQGPSGAGGFGYDPLLFLPEWGCTVAELPSHEKNRVSHRAKAARALRVFMENSGEGGE